MNLEVKYYGFVYETTNLIDNKKYIGKCILSRKNNWKDYLGSGTYLTRAIKKYGKENFTREIICFAVDDEELNFLEEFFIDVCNAVQSPNYYNLKKTSIGGDTYTYHPNKKEISKKKSLKLSGENNPMYGVQKTERMINSVKESNSKKVMINDKVYPSVLEYCRIYNINNITIIYARLHSNHHPGYMFLDKNDNPIYKPKPIKKDRTGLGAPKKIIVNGVVFRSINDCSKKTNEPRGLITKKLNDDNFINYQYYKTNESKCVTTIETTSNDGRE